MELVKKKTKNLSRFFILIVLNYYNYFIEVHYYLH